MAIQAQTRSREGVHTWLVRLLRSPFHKLLDQSMMLVTVVGRKSGKSYTLPVNFVRDGNDLVVMSRTDRTWWRNAYNRSIAMYINGCDFYGQTEVITEKSRIIDMIYDLAARVPEFRSMYGIHVDTYMKPTDLSRVALLAKDGVVIRISNVHPVAILEPMIDG